MSARPSTKIKVNRFEHHTAITQPDLIIGDQVGVSIQIRNSEVPALITALQELQKDQYRDW
jgi:hypothetical protein